MSTLPSRNGSARASAHTRSGRRATPGRNAGSQPPAFARLSRSIGRARSSPITCAFGQRLRIETLACPGPQPTSTTTCGGARSSAGSSR